MGACGAFQVARAEVRGGMLCVRACRRAPPAVCMPKRPRIRSARAGQRPAPRHRQGEGPTAKSGRDSAQARARSTVKCCQNPGQIKSEPRSDRIRTGGQMNRNPHRRAGAGADRQFGHGYRLQREHMSGKRSAPGRRRLVPPRFDGSRLGDQRRFRDAAGCALGAPVRRFVSGLRQRDLSREPVRQQCMRARRRQDGLQLRTRYPEVHDWLMRKAMVCEARGETELAIEYCERTIVDRRRRLTSRNRRDSTCYHADRRPICTLNNTRFS